MKRFISKHFGECISEKERCILLAEYLVENNATIRSTAQHFHISKSTVHKDIAERLYRIHPTLYKQAHEILMHNKEERHIRGGKATQNKYRTLRNKIRETEQKKT